MTGKQSVTVKTMVADEVADDLQRFARERGYGSVSDCVRELILVSLYGTEYLADLHRQRIASLVQHRDTTGTAVR